MLFLMGVALNSGGEDRFTVLHMVVHGLFRMGFSPTKSFLCLLVFFLYVW